MRNHGREKNKVEKDGNYGGSEESGGGRERKKRVRGLGGKRISKKN